MACNLEDWLEIHLRYRLTVGINIPNIEKEYIQKPTSSFKKIKTYIYYRAVNELGFQSVRISNSLLICHDDLYSQGCPSSLVINSGSRFRGNVKNDSTKNRKVGYRGKRRFSECVSCDKFHSRNSCVFRRAKMKHLKSVSKVTVHFATRVGKSSSSVFIELGVSNDHLSQSTSLEGNFHIEKPLYTSLGSFHDYCSHRRYGVHCLFQEFEVFKF